MLGIARVVPSCDAFTAIGAVQPVEPLYDRGYERVLLGAHKLTEGHPRHVADLAGLGAQVQGMRLETRHKIKVRLPPGEAVAVPEGEDGAEGGPHTRLLEDLARGSLRESLAGVDEAARELPLQPRLASSSGDVAPLPDKEELLRIVDDEACCPHLVRCSRGHFVLKVRLQPALEHRLFALGVVESEAMLRRYGCHSRVFYGHLEPCRLQPLFPPRIKAGANALRKGGYVCGGQRDKHAAVWKLGCSQGCEHGRGEGAREERGEHHRHARADDPR
mmetsp:Transcript_28108/g.82605  ORF Transcript_28108/g.82605 Transcript_28108/m.82605 type:complete len:275 (-) Transcript_28108:37-861(-)